jgi:hypothetical protein
MLGFGLGPLEGRPHIQDPPGSSTASRGRTAPSREELVGTEASSLGPSPGPQHESHFLSAKAQCHIFTAW